MQNSCRRWSALLVAFSACQCQSTLSRDRKQHIPLKSTSLLIWGLEMPSGPGSNIVLLPTRCSSARGPSASASSQTDHWKPQAGPSLSTVDNKHTSPSPQASRSPANLARFRFRKPSSRPLSVVCASGFFSRGACLSFCPHPLSPSCGGNTEEPFLLSLELPWLIFLLLVSWQRVLEGTGYHIFLCVYFLNVCFPPPSSVKAGSTSPLFTSISPTPGPRPASLGAGLS